MYGSATGREYHSGPPLNHGLDHNAVHYQTTLHSRHGPLTARDKGCGGELDRSWMLVDVLTTQGFRGDPDVSDRNFEASSVRERTPSLR